MTLTWHWPWIGLAGLVLALALVAAIVAASRFRHPRDPSAAQVFSLDKDLRGEEATRLFHLWRNMGRLAVAGMALCLLLSLALVARPSQVDEDSEHANSRDIVLCLDVSGSTLPYDREVIETYLRMVSSFKGERIGMTIFNSTARTVFPLTDDYHLVSNQLKTADRILKGVQTQQDIDKMKDRDYQAISDWLEGTQNRKDATSLIGDGVVSCAAMLPGFAYGTANSQRPNRSVSIVLATDNVVSGTPSYSLEQALELTSKARIGVDGLYSGPKQSQADQEAKEMKSLIEQHGGVFMTQADGPSIGELVSNIEQRKDAQIKEGNQAAMVDAPGWWVLVLVAALALWIPLTWRLRR
ncbi:VWA domain-containing protein [Bifidobacterium aemilianum]|uniref:VWA domain-containing protein n=1 Tax=Bifidobacterium aemilianum TaxID=2493120 RepID=A0A366K9P4_9BIFI|nr:VWA domain-containing protein [Bifidobacterium aemilianum]RBP98414.1 VWA domain-containing protein [Bifidobacterium aemilianum]